MACENCEALESDVSYLEDRVDELVNQIDGLEREHEADLLRLGRQIDSLESELEDSVDPSDVRDEAQFLVSLFNLETSSSSMTDSYKLALAKALINALLETMGVRTCQLSV